MSHFLTFVGGIAAGVALLLGVLVSREVRLSEPQPATLATPPAVVRMLDVTIRDSNTTNRRQRFECLPVVAP